MRAVIMVVALTFALVLCGGCEKHVKEARSNAPSNQGTHLLDRCQEWR